MPLRTRPIEMRDGQHQRFWHILLMVRMKRLFRPTAADTLYSQALPFGGVKASGYGRFGGPEGLRALCNVKAVIEDRLHGLIQVS